MDASAAPDEDGEQGCINKLYRSPVNCNGYFSRSGLKKCVLVLVVLIVLGVIVVGYLLYLEKKQPWCSQCREWSMRTNAQQQQREECMEKGWEC